MGQQPRAHRLTRGRLVGQPLVRLDNCRAVHVASEAALISHLVLHGLVGHPEDVRLTGIDLACYAFDDEVAWLRAHDTFKRRDLRVIDPLVVTTNDHNWTSLG